jgi:hypothetical protein
LQHQRSVFLAAQFSSTRHEPGLKVRLRAALDRRVVTEAGLRKLDEEGKACALTLNARLERSERRLAELSSDPESSLAEIAAEVRAANELARESRASWLAAR